jgi:exopolysaccharide production protein ExoQ
VRGTDPDPNTFGHMTAPESERALFPNLRSGRREDRAAGAFRETLLLAAERLALFWAIMIFCGIGSFGQVDLNPGNTNAVNSYSNALFLVMFGGLAAVNFRKTRDFLPFSYLLIGFVVLAAFSAVWSVDSGVTLRRVGTLITTLLVSVHLTWRFDTTKGVSIIGHAVLIICVLSLGTVILMPQVGVTQPTPDNTADLVGTWKGVLPTKNTLGWTCIAGFQVYLWRFIAEREKRWRHFAALVLIVFIALETRSATALIGIMLSTVLLIVLNLRRWQSSKRIALEWTVLGLICLAISAVCLFPAEVFGLFGKSADLTGRVPLWITVFDSIWQRPFLGYGYGAFWVNDNPEMLRIWSLNPWQPPNAHNGFLDVTLDLGFVGLALAVLIILIGVKRALFWCKQPEAPWATYVGTLLIVLIVTALTETAFHRGGELLCLLLSFCYFTLIRAQRHRTTAEVDGDVESDAVTRQRPAGRQLLRF